MEHSARVPGGDTFGPAAVTTSLEIRNSTCLRGGERAAVGCDAGVTNSRSNAGNLRD
jgi:hypothetical protein